MARYAKLDGFYGVTIITGPRSVHLKLDLRGDRTSVPEVVPLSTEFPYRNPDAATVRARVLEGTDEANKEFGTSYHPWVVRYAVEDFNEHCCLLRRAAQYIVQRLAEKGESGYEADWV